MTTPKAKTPKTFRCMDCDRLAKKAHWIDVRDEQRIAVCAHCSDRRQDNKASWLEALETAEHFVAEALKSSPKGKDKQQAHLNEVWLACGVFMQGFLAFTGAQADGFFDGPGDVEAGDVECGCEASTHNHLH